MAFDFLIFSDIHCHNFTYGASRTTVPKVKGLYNSRLADSIAVLDEILEYALEHGIDTVFFCGDLFHRRSSVSTDVRHLVMERLHSFADESIELHMIPGNHDMGDRKGHVHSLVGLGEMDYIYVYDTVDMMSWPARNVHFVFVPYSDNSVDAKNNLKSAGEYADTVDDPVILFAHLGIQGAKVGSDYVLVNDSDISVSDISSDKFAACFFGHFHEHQPVFKQGWFVGATHQHNWGDQNGARGFLHATFDKGEISFKRVETKAPKFITVHAGMDDMPEIKANDFVRYISSDKFVEKTLVQQKLGATNVEILYSSEEEEEEFKLDSTKLTPSAMLEQWVESKLPADLEKDKVLQVGRDILEEVDL